MRCFFQFLNKKHNDPSRERFRVFKTLNQFLLTLEQKLKHSLLELHIHMHMCPINLFKETQERHELEEKTRK
jgi:hypothetical protein